jgi:predicted XRE-type DNA-binding protein
MRYKSTTGLSSEQFEEISGRVWEILDGRHIDESKFLLDFVEQVELTLMILRQNCSQMMAAEYFGVSQATVSRVFARMVPLLCKVAAFNELKLSDAGNGRVLVVDGTFIPTGNRPGQGSVVAKGNFSGKHRVQCLGVQVAATSDGHLCTVSDPVPGSRHDSAALKLVGWEEELSQLDWIADTAYIGTNAITPRKKLKGETRSEADKIFNKSVSSIRSVIEHAIRHLKEWKIIATGYRGRLSDLPHIIRTITRLEVYRTGI